jgi:hypothetical protein
MRTAVAIDTSTSGNVPVPTTSLADAAKAAEKEKALSVCVSSC